MALPTANSMAKAAIQEIVDLVQVDGLPEDRLERREILRLLAKSDTAILTHCPETGRSLEGLDIAAHAANLWPHSLPLGSMSVEAREREAALYRAAGVKAPARR
jgi:hypothetical protein